MWHSLVVTLCLLANPTKCDPPKEYVFAHPTVCVVSQAQLANIVSTAYDQMFIKEYHCGR